MIYTRAMARAALLVCLGVLGLGVALAACGPNLGPGPDDRRGDTNGRMFDFVSDKPDGAEWTIRARGDSLWVAYSTRKEDKELGETTLTPKEAKKLWALVDDVSVDRDEEVDPEADDGGVGTVLLRIRQPTDDGDHDIISVYVPRDTENQSVIDLANYLIDLVARHHKGVEPAF